MNPAAAPDIALSEAEEPEFTALLQAEIRRFNDAHSPPHRAARAASARRPLRLILKDSAGQMIGGLAGCVYWDWLEVEKLFVPEAWRGQGIGSALLGAAEDVARGWGARHCWLTTYAFQARAFYERHGYVVAGELAGYPPGSAYYWMRKDL